MPAANFTVAAAISETVRSLSEDDQLTVLLHVNRIIAKSLAANRPCPYQHKCRFGPNLCWSNHDATSANTQIDNPYSVAPSFSERCLRSEQVHSSLPSFPHRDGSPDSAAPAGGQARTPERSPLRENHQTSQLAHSGNTSSRSMCQAEPAHTNTPLTTNTDPNDNDSHSNEEPWITVKTQKRPRIPKAQAQSSHFVKQLDPDSETRVCKDCNSNFVLSNSTIDWYARMSLQTPLRCQEYRTENKARAASSSRTSNNQVKLPFVPDTTPPRLKARPLEVQPAPPILNQANFLWLQSANSVGASIKTNPNSDQKTAATSPPTPIKTANQKTSSNCSPTADLEQDDTLSAQESTTPNSEYDNDQAPDNSSDQESTSSGVPTLQSSSTDTTDDRPSGSCWDASSESNAPAPAVKPSYWSSEAQSKYDDPTTQEEFWSTISQPDPKLEPEPLPVKDLPEVKDCTGVRDKRLLYNLEKMLTDPDVRFHLKLDPWNWVATSYPDNFKSERYSAKMIELFLRRLKLNISRDTH